MEVDHNGIEGTEKSSQPKAKREKKTSDETEMRKIFVPSNRYTPLKENWMKIFTPVVEHLQLQIRFNLKSRNVEIKAGKDTKDIGMLL
jgi:RNA-binding protein PNO1